ncbi:Tim10/DDP family zinc finger [Ostreococcus tauri]|uniref:Mitochondrial import inner membrane translocase subunit n=1 Tax=Ostreococcus tauri TaxID=70448 RepID=A0A096PBT5_OSTTA|nr:Tim10/DDP family zinc finger [Ostreococcus tauri]CEG02122.1 Tim10/DDP family zinc finger [Ostreococcus tauri]|eukprot:XP_022841359.1 Tim10/DDP family zinc finger [Ostreococcus tauri]
MDPSMLEGFNDEDKAKMTSMIDAMQTRDSLRMYNNLVERCFSTCVQSFRRKTLEQDEEKCVSKCCEKFLKHSARASVRFAELNAASMQEAMAQAGEPAGK